MFTGRGREEIAIKALNLGATRYFTKQGDPATVYGELSYGIIHSVQQARLSFSLKQKSAIIESVIENIGAGLKIIGKDYRIIWANKYLKSLGGEDGKFCYSVFNKLNAVCPDCGVRKIFEEGSALNSHECTSVDSKGEVFWIEFIVSPIRDERGNVVAALELALSTTERKKNEAQLMSANCRIHVLEELKAEINRLIKVQN
jgi:PAS domain-containing protein